MADPAANIPDINMRLYFFCLVVFISFQHPCGMGRSFMVTVGWLPPLLIAYLCSRKFWFQITWFKWKKIKQNLINFYFSFLEKKNNPLKIYNLPWNEFFVLHFVLNNLEQTFFLLIEKDVFLSFYKKGQNDYPTN